MQLYDRTLAALDWAVVLEGLARHARTLRGADAARRPAFHQDPEAVAAAYAAVAEVRLLEDGGSRVPVGAVSDVRDELLRCSRGATLEPSELRSIGSTMQALRHLRHFLEEADADLPELRRRALPITVDAELCDLLGRSFDDEGNLSEREYPELGELRRRILSLRARIRTVLDELVRGDILGDALQDRYVTERDGRFVIPIRADRRKGLGIVHGRSQSGETAFVEPAAVVELHNDASEAEAALHREESRILGGLSRMVGRFHDPLQAALDAATDVDLCCARAGLGKQLGGVAPIVGADGVIALQQGRHPVLALRGIDVVPNDLSLDGRRPGLVLSGPNTGGKTVALKTLGLAALLVRAGIPVPCAPGSRVDLFVPVVADVGDWQSVEGDLSTFSGHVEVLKAVLAVAGPGALVMLDEVGMGTDPAQGAALARSILEALVDSGARVAITTHYTELKALASVDPRFAVASVAMAEGRPTYEVVMGAVGESHALAIARRLALPEPVLTRARALLDAAQRDMSDLVLQLEEERGELRRLRREAEQARAALHTREQALAHKEAKLAEQRAAVRDQESERFRARMKAREHELKGLIAALQANPDLRLAGRTLDKVREAIDDTRADETPAPAGPPPAELSPGDAVRVRSLSRKAEVVRLLKGDQVEVRIGTMKMKVALDDLEGLRGERFAPPAPPALPAADPEPAAKASSSGKAQGLRVDANTLDLRGHRVDESIELVDRFIAEIGASSFKVGWILHGHGTGALKQAVRAHLPHALSVRSWRPADADEGGDAFTVFEA
ncbi:MAG: Smr/MutS family protein [Alphaproteobacteria bacterium]|nr:Smr/MutS family protein [Alphaproteobacteria bacterium]